MRTYDDLLYLYILLCCALFLLLSDEESHWSFETVPSVYLGRA